MLEGETRRRNGQQFHARRRRSRSTTAYLGEGEKTGRRGENPIESGRFGFDWILDRSGKRNETIQRVSFLFTPPSARFFASGYLASMMSFTAVPTGDAGAWGRVGESQLVRLETLLTASEVKSRRRVVLIHHPPLVNRHGEERNLRDRAAVQAVLARTGADLVLHGHDHRDFFNDLPGPDGARIPVVGAGSASYDGPRHSRSRYNIYEITDATITVITYVHDPASNTFSEFGRKTL